MFNEISCKRATGVLVIKKKNYSGLKSLEYPVFFITINETRDFEINLLLCRLRERSLGSELYDLIDLWTYRV